ncbi:membrane protein [Lentibacillus kapialis]|uniref:Membrane protein n=1 Tax=Lentibacillus kapialis TaxID=340214 RepID=A0A917PR44_9BACI|nr:YjiH family protein [Lentibacillus kapialis]GGJ88462.1 membrane protein [Lentibacillus kapialis]
MEEKKKNVSRNQYRTTSNYIKFILFSLIGAGLFLVPVPYNGETNIGVGILAGMLEGAFKDYWPVFMTIIFCLSTVLAMYTKVVKPAFMKKNTFVQSLFDVSLFWIIMRLIGSIFAIMTLNEVGPQWIWSEATGGTVLFSLVPVLATFFLAAGILMPLLLEFGLMEFIGTVLHKVMQPLFRLPGRSSIDATASWMGSGTVGVVITTEQYERGYYTDREASVVATNFSINSIAFSFVVISVIGLTDMFVPFYLTVCIASVVAAIICPRIPPLSRKKDTYHEPVGKQIDETAPSGVSSFKWGIEKALEKASNIKNFRGVAKGGFKVVADIWFSLIPLVMSLGTIALIIAEFTPVFQILSYPFVPLLNLLQIPEAAAAAPAMIVGFADMFLPAVIASGIESELTRFVIAAMSLTQLIYMSEIGILLLKSKIKISFWDLVIVFLERTIITLPIVVFIAHVFFF